MKKNGFTLIELLGVIALLAILSLIAVPAIDNALKSSRGKLTKTQEEQIIKGAKEFFSENLACLPGNDHGKCLINESDIALECNQDNDKCSITLAYLKQEGYLPANITDFNKNDKDSNRNYDDTTKVVVTKKNSNFEYKVEQ